MKWGFFKNPVVDVGKPGIVQYESEKTNVYQE